MIAELVGISLVLPALNVPVTVLPSNWFNSVAVEDKKYTVESFWVEWESNLYWYLGDTLGYVVKRNFNDAGMYVSYDTVYVTNFSGMEVPTSNKISYSSSDGVFNNMIAPVRSMIGDTLKLTAYWYDGKKDFYIVLD